MNKKPLIIALIAIVLIAVVYFFVFHKSDKEASKAPVAKSKAVIPEKTATNPEAVEQKAAIQTEEQRKIDELSKAIAAAPNDANNFYKRGIIYLQTKQNRLAIHDFTAALRLMPKSPYVLYNRALAYRQDFNYEGALADLSAAITAKPDFVDAYNTRGLTYVDLERYNEALADYNQALTLNDKFSDVYFNMGTLYMRSKKYADAKQSFEKAIKTNAAPKNADEAQLIMMQKKLMQDYLNLARAELMLQDYEAALKDATYVVSNDAGNVDALRLRAEIYENMGNAASAAADTATADGLSLQKMIEKKK